jgi:hypothetical protein
MHNTSPDCVCMLETVDPKDFNKSYALYFLFRVLFNDLESNITTVDSRLRSQAVGREMKGLVKCPTTRRETIFDGLSEEFYNCDSGVVVKIAWGGIHVTSGLG